MPVAYSNTFWAKFYHLLDNNGYELKPAWEQAKAHMQARHHLTDDETNTYSRQLWETFCAWC